MSMRKLLIVIFFSLMVLLVACKPSFLQNDVEKARKSPLYNPNSLADCEKINLKLIMDDYTTYQGSGCYNFHMFDDEGKPLELNQKVSPYYAFIPPKGMPPSVAGITQLINRKQELQEKYGFKDDSLYYDVCKKILMNIVEQKKRECIQNVGVESKEPFQEDEYGLSKCEQIKGDNKINERRVCYNNLYLSSYRDIVIGKKDVTMCEKILIDSIREMCYTDLAKALNDLKICDKINFPNSKNTCIRLIAENEENLALCDEIGNIDDKTWCYIGIAKIKKDVKLCERLPTPHREFTNWFKHWCYSDVAEATCDKSICERIGSEGVGDNARKGCFEKVSSYKCK